MGSRLHDKNYFYKYTSAETALKIIKTKSFRWSSPLKFNDPFDHQTGFVFASEPEYFSKLLRDSIIRIIFSDEEPNIQPHSLFSAMTLKLRSIRDRLSRDEVIKDFDEAGIEIASNLPKHFADFNAALVENFCNSRIFCVSENHDNVVMWSHYADQHRGIVFKLACLDDIDNVLLAARKVEYTKDFIKFHNAEDYAMHLTGEKPLDTVDLCWKLAFTKHADWAYENEWRVHRPLLNEPQGDGYSIYSEHPRVFDEIYLGCRIPKEMAQNIIDTTRAYLPHVKIFQGAKSTNKFSLSFTKI